MTDSRHVTVNVESGDPHNDQMVARASGDLARHITSAYATLTQAGPGGRTEATTVVAVALIDNPDVYPRDRLAAMLAAALVMLAEENLA